ncbi:MAG: uracil-DNA glycosylase [Christensenellales bacterium]
MAMQISWQQLTDAILSCTACPLCQGIRNKVPGQGNPHARLMLIGEGPGAQEDEQGLAFVGAAGQLLTRMLAAIDITREEVFIANIVKCRPPDNRQPTPQEAEQCLPYLRGQVALIRPQVIMLMGATALRHTISPDARITSARGKWIERAGVWMMPTYHPAALLRDPAKKRDAWEDLKMVRDKLQELSV